MDVKEKALELKVSMLKNKDILGSIFFYKKSMSIQPADITLIGQQMREFGHHIGTYMEPLFWYIYAESQWITQCPTQEVKSKANEWLEKDGGMELWEDIAVLDGAGC